MTRLGRRPTEDCEAGAPRSAGRLTREVLYGWPAGGVNRPPGRGSMAGVDPDPPPALPSDHRSFGRWLVGTEPVALVLLLAVAVLLLALNVIGVGHHGTARPTATPTTAAAEGR